MHHTMKFSSYYQAEVDRKWTWYFVAILRSFEYLVFDRTLDKTTGTFEFFVPEAMEKPFLDLLSYFEKEGILSQLRKVPNRLA